MAEILAVLQWFIILFTGKRNEGALGPAVGLARLRQPVNGYVDLLFDPYPAFGTDPGTVPIARTSTTTNRPTG